MMSYTEWAEILEWHGLIDHQLMWGACEPPKKKKDDDKKKKRMITPVL